MICFNRTFMELKFEGDGSLIDDDEKVLIVPLWNWNLLSMKLMIFSACFNRTFMELKLSSPYGMKTRQTVLIVPLWN